MNSKENAQTGTEKGGLCMNSNDLYRAMSGIDNDILERSEITGKGNRRPGWITRSVMAACLFLAIAVAAVLVCAPFGGMTVTAYAYGIDQKITTSGATFITGTLHDDGTLTGHPLLFRLSGKEIDTVRFSCQNGLLNFIDLTEQRDEYGFAQNFTVTYGADEYDQSSLLIDWLPKSVIEALQADDTTIASLPESLRHDVIVMELTFADGKSATKAMMISLNDDGTIDAAFQDYTISTSDDFVCRTDSASIPRDTLYQQGDMDVVFYDADENEVLPEANWYITKNMEQVVVQWNGRTPDMVQMLFTPAGTETAEQMEFLTTDVISAENKVVLSADSLHQDSLMGHLQIVITFGNNTVKSDLYNVIYDPDA
jgi:hypothetical protein